MSVGSGKWDSLKAPGALCGRQFTSRAGCSASHAGECLVSGFPASSVTWTFEDICVVREVQRKLQALVCMSKHTDRAEQ